MKSSRFSRLVLAGLCFAVLVPAAGESSDTEKKDVQVCTEHLKKVHAAIQKYREDHKRLPNWLSDLVDGDYLDKEALLCPFTKRTGRSTLFGLGDPKIETSYIYEFCAAPIPRPDLGWLAEDHARLETTTDGSRWVSRSDAQVSQSPTGPQCLL